ncbi:hypothetical protein GGS20DRAFT_532478 [Poronia punctata]|nr:hypothetical protein GGS20DRAFT_532478 [Poronia punctata]
MSRPSQSSSSRNLTLTEELERLEQSITLTLQEIDHNFNKAHRIVTTSILPLVEQYGEHSKNVWEASKFWKQFFEASANVSLSGYEELAEGANESTVAEETLEESTSQYNNTTEHDVTAESAGYQDQEHTEEIGGESLLEDVTITGSTPRPSTKTTRPQFAGFDSPYQALRRELKDESTPQRQLFPPRDDSPGVDEDDDTVQLPPQGRTTTIRLPDMSMTPRSSSVFEPPTPSAQSTARKPKDMLLHRVLDKTYRLQATPLKNAGPSSWARGRSPQRTGIAEEPEERTQLDLGEESPMSSPEMEVPKLRSHMLISPAKTRGRDGPPIPGVSVQTPATSKKRDIFADARDKGKKKDEITWESDEDDDLFGDLSPPKTIQFALPPSRLLQTPAQEAGRRMVDDVLRAAADEEEDISEHSPTFMVGRDILDDTF